MTYSTELRFHFSPADFFERGQKMILISGTLTLENGTATLLLSVPLDPVPTKVIEDARSELAALLNVQSLATRRSHTLSEGANIQQHTSAGTSHVIVMATGRLHYQEGQSALPSKFEVLMGRLSATRSS